MITTARARSAQLRRENCTESYNERDTIDIGDRIVTISLLSWLVILSDRMKLLYYYTSNGSAVQERREEKKTEEI